MSLLKKALEMSRNNSRFVLFVFIKLVSQFISLLISIIIIRRLSTYSYGIYSIVFMIIGLITSLGFNWSTSVMVFHGAKERADTGSINTTFWSRNIIFGGSFVLVSVALFILYNEIVAYCGGDYMIYIIGIAYTKAVTYYLSYYFLSIDKKKILSNITVLISRLVLILLLAIYNIDLHLLLKLTLISEVVPLIMIVFINKSDFGKPVFDKKKFFEILNFSMWQLFGFSGLYIINFGDNAVIKMFLSIEAIGVYNSAYKLFYSLSMLSYMITQFFASTISVYFLKKDYMNIHKFYYKKRLVLLLLIVLVHIGVICIAHPFILTLYGKRYIEAINIFRILLIGSFFKYVEAFYVIYYNNTGRHRVLQFANIGQAIGNIGLNFIYIRFFGLIGAAIATTTAMAGKTVFSYFYLEKKIAVDGRKGDE